MKIQVANNNNSDGGNSLSDTRNTSNGLSEFHVMEAVNMTISASSYACNREFHL